MEEQIITLYRRRSFKVWDVHVHDEKHVIVIMISISRTGTENDWSTRSGGAAHSLDPGRRQVGGPILPLKRKRSHPEFGPASCSEQLGTLGARHGYREQRHKYSIFLFFCYEKNI